MKLSSVPFDYGVKCLYSEEEFQAKRAEITAEDGYDPVGNGPKQRRIDLRGYHGKRVWYSPPWRLSEPWKPKIYGGHDEWCNPCRSVTLPFFLGELTFVMTRGEVRTYFSAPDPECDKDIGFPRCPLDHYYHYPHCLPVEMTCPACGTVWPSTERAYWSKKTDAAYCSRECAE